MELSDEQFDQLISRAMDELPQEYIRGLENVVIVMADEPTPEQREKLKMRGDQILLGLFEGIPRTHRGGYESGVLPDKITLFKHPILIASNYTHDELFPTIKRTLWHEIAHYFGLSHDDMDARQSS